MISSIPIYLSKFIRWILIIVVTKNIKTTDLILIVMLTTFRPICLSAFFMCFWSNSGAHLESRPDQSIKYTLYAHSYNVSSIYN